MGFDQGGGQRLVVDLLAGTQAQAAFPVFVGQGFIGAQLARFDPLGGVEDGPCAQRQASPAVSAGAILSGDIGVDQLGLGGLQYTFLLGLPEVAGVNSDQQVSRGVGPFGFQAGDQRRFLVGNELDLDPGFRGVGIEHRLDQLVDTRGIHHHFIGGLRSAGERSEGECGEQAFAYLHGVMPLGIDELRCQIVVNDI